MVKRILCLISSMLLLTAPIQVCAAPTDLPIQYTNSWTLSRDGGGEIQYTIPYTGNYEISLSGSQGSAYSNNSGGYGYTVVKEIRLQYGDVITIDTPNQPLGYVTSGSVTTIPGGNAGRLYLRNKDTNEDELVLVAAAGAAYVNNKIAEEGVTTVIALGGDGNTVGVQKEYPVHWHTGDGKLGPTHSNTFPRKTGATNPGGCYGPSTAYTNGHAHNAYGVSCPNCTHYHPAEYKSCDGTMQNMGHRQDADGSWHTESKCSKCGRQKAGDEGGGRCGKRRKVKDAYYEHAYDCWNSPTNVWDLRCGYAQGQIYRVLADGSANKTLDNDNSNRGVCGNAEGWTPDYQKANKNSGNAKCVIKLSEQSEVYYNEPKPKIYYKGSKPNLIITNNTVAYFKRP